MFIFYKIILSSNRHSVNVFKANYFSFFGIQTDKFIEKKHVFYSRRTTIIKTSKNIHFQYILKVYYDI